MVCNKKLFPLPYLPTINLNEAPPSATISTSCSNASISFFLPTVIYGKPVLGTTPPFNEFIKV